MILKVICKMSLAALLFIVSLGFVSSTSAAEPMGNSTPESYIDYLENLISTGDTGAVETLEQFKNLDESQQKAFVTFMFTANYEEVFKDMGNGKEINKNYFVDGIEVPVSIENESVGTSLNDVNMLAASGIAASASHSMKFNVFGIETTTLTLTVVWEHNNSVAVKPLSVTYAHVNRNPVMIISEVSNNNPGYITGGYYYGSGTWKSTATGAVGFITDTFGIKIKASTPKHRYYSTTSTHSNISGAPWTQF
ncbi:hypothetical protein C7121_29105 [Paenibacillus glucanolyticus]|uniref:hypothetical protein n=1 Tax=Paenibacillus TaxID=44249 RepID=UPI0003E1C2BE|nr:MULTISPECIES: hypothetical protein [Paenibacillus]ANA81375.1 hypothetical protein A3958_15945 [Paenibacillus glucanolyticus]AVV59894.1 hypothetical protein C7121_29105 [Paenibacillus glucanolyticus]AWP29152.1 hypothetical protein B9D94_22165 [Paenibacillus sp. Cedars]ETT35611.1 hypothetical protein C169_16424 [Paenibacillus sp. FSL R5-808]OMF72199.1 hypothetical protein BK142_20825 [Paenibacillus glucanolyticus]